MLGTNFIVRVAETILAAGRGASDFDCPYHWFCNRNGNSLVYTRRPRSSTAFALLSSVIPLLGHIMLGRASDTAEHVMRYPWLTGSFVAYLHKLFSCRPFLPNFNLIAVWAVGLCWWAPKMQITSTNDLYAIVCQPVSPSASFDGSSHQRFPHYRRHTKFVMADFKDDTWTNRWSR